MIDRRHILWLCVRVFRSVALRVSLIAVLICAAIISCSFGWSTVIKRMIGSPPPSPPPPPPTQCGYLVGMLKARLGNQMFNYASFYAIVKRQRNAAANKTVFTMTSDGLNADVYDIFDNLSVQQRSVTGKWLDSNQVVTVGIRDCCRFNGGADTRWTKNLSCDGSNVLVDGFWQSYKYFADCMPDIKREFTFTAKIKQKCEWLFYKMLATKDLNRSNTMTVGVHLRRADMTWKSSKRKGHWPAQAYYVKRAIRYFENLFYGGDTNNSTVAAAAVAVEDKRILAFLVFGDDPAWNKNVMDEINLLQPHRTRLIVNEGKSDAAVDMCVISSWCDNAAISTGTFGWWCGFLNQGTVTYQAQQARPGSQHEAEIGIDDYVLPKWIPL